MGTIIGSGLELYIKRDARDTAMNTVADAKRRAEEIMEQAQQRIEVMRRDSAENTILRVEQHRRRLLAQADLSAKQILLDRRAEVMGQVWDQVESELQADLPADERLALIGNGLADAAKQLGGGELTLLVNEQDTALIDKAQLDAWATALGLESLSLADEPAAIWGGAIVRCDATRQVVDNAWNQRMALAQRTLRDQVNRALTPND